MTIKRRGLGRNLDALLGGARQESHSTYSVNDLEAKSSESTDLKQIAIECIKPGQFQPRNVFTESALTELAESIKKQGVLSPLTVRHSKTDLNRYELIAGERRWRAAQLAGLRKVPVIIKDISDQDALAVALIENIQREDLNPMEEAFALRRLLDEFSMTHQEVADAVGKSRSTVSNLLRLMELNEDVKKLLEKGDLEMGHARALLALDGGQSQIQAAQLVVSKKLSVRETEKLVKSLLTQIEKPAKKIQMDVNVTKLIDELSDKLAAKVVINHSQSGKGKLIIHYHSLDELDGILEHIQ